MAVDRRSRRLHRQSMRARGKGFRTLEMGGVSRRSALKGGLAAVGALTAAAHHPCAGAAPTVPEAPAGRFDTVIVGAGCAGLACAVEAHDRGGKPIVLEKMSRPAGNSIYALGGINAVGTRYQREQGISDTVSDFYRDLMAVSLQRGDPALNRLYAERIADATHWLADVVGVRFLKIVVMPHPRLGRTHFVDGEGITGGAMLIRRLLQATRQRNIPILFDTKVVGLLTDSRMGVAGVRAQAESGAREFEAKGGVVIASGGYSANPEMLTKYVGGWAARLTVRGSPIVTGENISLTLPVFAKLVNMDQFHAGPIVAETHVNPAELVDSGIGIIVTLQGKRFIDESATYVAKAKLLPQLTRENRALQIVDSDAAMLEAVAAKYRNFNSVFYEAETISGLARAAGLPVEETVRTVDQFNAAVRKNGLRELVPPNTVKAPRPIARAPFYAFPFEGGMTATFGGPKINTRAEVVNLEDQPIPGLYAAGNAAGGLFFDDYIGGTQLGAATVFGRIAAEQTVARATKR